MPAAVLHRSRPDDAELAERVRAGDAAAFELLDARHRKALQRYAGALLRRSEHDAEDVVQDVLISAHDALRSGDGPDELQPWLYRLTRNRAIDEVRRARWGDESLDSAHAFRDARGGEEPDAVLGRRDSMRRLVEDLADLPVRQRTALLARELDGHSAEQVAAQLGVSVMAAHKLASRARESLIKTRAARDADCPDVRAALLDAHERGVRPSEHALRHARTCDGCRAHRRELRRLSRRLHALNPAVGLPLLAGVAKLAGGSAPKLAAGAAVSVALVATGGIVVLASNVHEAGDPAPFRLLSVRDSAGRVVTRGKPIPQNLTIVTAKVQLAAGPRTTSTGPNAHPTITLPCPKGMKLGSLQLPNRELGPKIALGYSKDSIPGYSTSGRITVAHRGLTRSAIFTLGIDCRRPNAYGSINRDSRRLERALQRGERQLAHVCTTGQGVILRTRPGGRPQDYIWRGAPVAIQRRSATKTWTLVVPDQMPRGKLIQGWLRTSRLCP